MDNELQTAQRDLAILRRTVADLDALALPGEYDLQQAALLTVHQLYVRVHQRVKQLQGSGRVSA